ncbi:MAG: FAD:protein FMN transferase [Pseudomonadota bacterium]
MARLMMPLLSNNRVTNKAIRFFTFRTQAVCAVLLLCVLAGCSSSNVPKQLLDGETMGTRYHITVFAKLTDAQRKGLHGELQSELDSIEALMSSYQADSQLMKLNRWSKKDKFTIDEHVFNVLTRAQTIHDMSDGAFDISLSPLIELWGFATKKPTSSVPSRQQINAMKARVDLPSLVLSREPCVEQDSVLTPAMIPTTTRATTPTVTPVTVAKTMPNATCHYAEKGKSNVTFNVSAIAKGYAVDVLSNALKIKGYDNFLVEVGGEVYASGSKPNDEPWRLGLEQPDKAPGDVQVAVRLRDASIATSGDYRNFFMRDGKRYSHTLDPRTGQPIEHKLASVSVIASNAMDADAWATALNVQGLEEGYDTAIKHNLAVYFIQRQASGFVVRYTPLFKRYLERGDS